MCRLSRVGCRDGGPLNHHDGSRIGALESEVDGALLDGG
jgi:hypothetical protein